MSGSAFLCCDEARLTWKVKFRKVHFDFSHLLGYLYTSKANGSPSNGYRQSPELFDDKEKEGLH
jgi:hypothetical protein